MSDNPPEPFSHASIAPAATRRLKGLRGDFLDLAPEQALEFVRAVRKRRMSPVGPLKAAMLEKAAKTKKNSKAKG